MIKIILVEDNLFLLRALEEKLSIFNDIVIKSTAQNGNEVLQQLEKNHNVDIILMDIQMPVMNGILATEIIKQKYPQIKIMMITVFDNDQNILEAIKAGADGYLLKDSSSDRIYLAIKEILSGGAHMTPSIALKTLNILKNPELLNNNQISQKVVLSNREVEVLEQLSKGLKNKQIAENLFVSISTIKKHIENIYQKLQVHNRIEMLQKAKQNNLL